MRALATLIGRELTWRRSGPFSRSCELSSTPDVAITIEETGRLRRKARIRSAGGEWMFSRERVVGSTWLILDSRGEEIGRFLRGRFRTGTLRFGDGAGYTVKAGFFGSAAVVVNTVGSPIVQTRWKFPGLRVLATVAIEPAGSADSKLELLTALSLLILMDRRRRAAASGGG